MPVVGPMIQDRGGRHQRAADRAGVDQGARLLEAGAENRVGSDAEPETATFSRIDEGGGLLQRGPQRLLAKTCLPALSAAMVVA